MRLWNRNPDILQFGRVVHKPRPRKTKVTFLVKATFRLVPDGVAEPLAPRDPALPDMIWLTVGPAVLEQRPDLPSGDQPLGQPAPLGELPVDLNRYDSDFAPFKPRADILVAASAHAPGGQEVRKLDVALRVGPVAKTLRVVGDYAFVDGRATEVVPFTSLPITYANAYGGPDFPANPTGRGHAAALDDQGREVRVMHNIQWPDETPHPEAEPAGFGPFPRFWSQRGQGQMGTYDDAWLKQAWPWFPDDFQWSHFNAAPLDQQVTGYLRGDEAMVFENLHPEHPVLRCALPGLRARMFFKDLVTLPVDEEPGEEPPAPAKPAAAPPPPPAPLPAVPPDTPMPDGSLATPTPLDWQAALAPESEALEKAMKAEFPPFKTTREVDRPFRWREVRLALDTLFVDLEAGKINLVWRGVVSMRTQKLRELGDVFILAEPLDEPEHPAKHYLALLEEQKEKVQAAFDPPPGTPAPEEIYETIKVKVEAGKRLMDKAKALGEREKARYAAFAEKVKGMPMPAAPSVPAPALAKPSLAPAPIKAAGGAAGAPDPVDEALRKIIGELAPTEPKKAAAIQAQMNFAASGAPFDQHPEALAATAKRKEAESEIEAGKRKAEAILAEALRPLIGDAPVTGLVFKDRASFLEAANAGKDLRRATFIEVDLTRLDLSGFDLTGGSFLACVFDGSHFKRAKFARASFLAGSFEDVNLEGAVLDGWATLECRFRRTRFNGASIASVVFANHDFPECDFTDVRGEAPLFVNAGLDGVSFADAHLDKGFFHGARLAGANFAGAKMEKGHFGAVRAAGISMRGAEIDGFRAIEGADFRGGDFQGIRAIRSNWEQAKLGDANFTRAVLTDSILNEVRAQRAVFDRAHLQRVWFEEADLRRARLTNANLLRANFERADLTECDLSQSNLYEAWMLDTIFENTAVHGAFRKRTLIENLEPAAGGARS